MRNRGEKHYRAKLTDDDVRLIRRAEIERRRLREQAEQLSNRALAEKFGVSPRCIERVLGDGWSHVA